MIILQDFIVHLYLWFHFSIAYSREKIAYIIMKHPFLE